MPRLSIIVPVHGQPELLEKCLESIRSASFADYELLVVDDGSPRGEALQSAAAKYKAEYIRCPIRRGSAAARNRAAAVATGDQLVFIDSDVTIREETLGLIARSFDENPEVDALFGSYDRKPACSSMTSQFRNLLHAHAHQRSGPEATTFWTGCGAIRRERFQSLGGFKESFERPSIEDVELGLRLHREGGKILMVREIQVTHHKLWRLAEMVRTDLFARAMPWAALVHEHGLPRNLNFRSGDRAAVALTGLAAPLLWIALLHGFAFWCLLAVVLTAIAICQGAFLRFLGQVKGTLFAIRCFPLLLLYNLTCAVGLFAGLFRFECRRDRWLTPSLILFGCVILGFQIEGRAYKAEFDSNPDEAAHFVSALMVYDYVTTLPRENALRWAEQYYLHYPKVAIGHWPPVFYLVEAGWWLMAPPSRASAIALNGLLSLLVAALCYRLARKIAPPWAACCVTLLLICTPVMQQGAAECMAEVLCVLWALLVTDALIRLLTKPSLASAGLTGFWLLCALQTKGTGACLVLAPILVFCLSGKWRALFQRRGLWVGVLFVAAGFGWYLLEGTVLHQNLQTESGVGLSALPIADWVRGLTGYGLGLLALAGIVAALVRRSPLVIACAAVLGSTLIVSRFLGAMTEPRHYIIILPALLLLAVEAMLWARTQTRFAFVLPLLALAWFPFKVYQQQPADFVKMAAQLDLPARMLVSSSGAGEGPWIAAVALREKREASVVVRATKTLASSTWDGDNYHLRIKTAREIGIKLDELGLTLVVVHAPPHTKIPPHQVLLDQMLEESTAWRECASAQSLRAFCRVGPLAGLRQPLEIDLRQRIGRSVSE